jgi:hypothetical protein
MSTSTVALSHSRGLLRWLGYAGLLPFVACLAVMLLSDDRNWQAQAASQLISYAALIASFLGAVHWGAAFYDRQGQQGARLAWGVTPALAAWSLLSLPQGMALAGLAALFSLILLVDYRLLPLLGEDYRRLRLRLSAVVIACLLTAAWVYTGTPL